MKKMKTCRRIVGFLLSGAMLFPMGAALLSGCGGGEEDAERYYALSEVTLTDDYAVNALDKELDYLLSLDADRLLYYFHRNAALAPKASSSYGGGWEDALIGGHTMGHYLSALAQAYANASTGEEDRTAVEERLDYLLFELEQCQGNSQGEPGFLWGARTMGSDVEFQFNNVEFGLSNIATQAWVPWYTMHKIMAGLIDVYELTGKEDALDIATSLGDWVYGRVSGWSEATQATVLSIEYGGMNDCMYDLYAITGEERYAVTAHRFDEQTLFDDILSDRADYLNNRHANTTIPKIIGALNRYLTCDGKEIEGEIVDAAEMLTVAEMFWTRVVEHHTYITGGNSEWEHFGRDDVLNAERTNCNCETCNTYNMLKLSRMLFTITRDVKYLDYYERTYYNAIWSSQNPETGMTTYFQPMASGYFKVYSTPEENFWCCTGSGMESFTKLNDSIYYPAEDGVYVALFLDSTLQTEHFTLVQSADLENSDEIRFSLTAGETRLYLRVPSWSASCALTLNGTALPVQEEGGFVAVSLEEGDELMFTVEKTVTVHNLPDAENVYAFSYGPFVLSVELGSENMTTTTTGVNVTIPQRSAWEGETVNVTGTLQAFLGDPARNLVRGEDGKFTLSGTDRALTYSYHFRQHTQRYGIYFAFYGSDVEEETDAAYTYEVIDTVQPGYGQYEADVWHEMQESGSVGSTSDIAAGGTTRYAQSGGYFSYDMAVDPAGENWLVAYFTQQDVGRSIRIRAGEQVIYSATLAYDVGTEPYEVLIHIPDEIAAAATEKRVGEETRTVLTFTFDSADDGPSARLCSYIHTAKVTFAHAPFAGERDENIAYFVDCGDYDTDTLSAGDAFGMYNSRTEQLFGIDYATGRYWGIVDGSDPAAGTAGSASTAGGISTANTWAYEFLSGDDADKAASSRYTKNQYENQMARTLSYLFELEDGTYDVTVYFDDPWNCSKDVCMDANGERVLSNAATGTPITVRVQVTGGYLRLDFTTTDLCINLSYIIISFA